MNEKTRNFLDRTPQTDTELIAQRLISIHTKTHLLQLERSMRNLDKALYSSKLKQISVLQLFAAINYAKEIVCDTEPNEHSSM